MSSFLDKFKFAMMNTSSKAWANAHKQAALNQKKREEDWAWQKSLRIAELKKEARIQAERNKAKKEKNMKSHLLWRWDFWGLLSSVCMGLGCYCLPRLLVGGAQANLDSGDVDGAEIVMLMLDGLFPFLLVGFWLSFPCGLFFGVKFCRRFFSAEARSRRILDREEWLDADRRRRQEGGQVD